LTPRVGRPPGNNSRIVARDSQFEPIRPAPLRGPRVRDLRADGQGRKLIGRALRARGDQRRAIVRDLLFRVASQFTPSLAVDVDGLRFHLNTADKEISRIVFIFGAYDLPLMHAAFAGLDRLGGSADLEGRWLLDIGANIGTTTLTAVAYFRAAGAVAFEPDPTNLDFLGLNVRENGLDDRVQVHGVALSDQAGSVRLERSRSNAGDHRVLTGQENGTSSPGAEVIDVASTTLDDLVDAGDLDLSEIGIAWLDVQGHEGHVLAGATSLLESAIPIVLEYWPAGLRASGRLEPLNDLIEEHFDRCLDLGGPTGAPSLDPLPTAELARLADRRSGPDDHTDLLLVPRSLGA
jgi:FkbM family methyltransferase